MPSASFHASIHNEFDSAGFLDELQFEEDLSDFSPNIGLLQSPHSGKHKTFDSSKLVRWTEEEVS
jgi:hypothetical protein